MLELCHIEKTFLSRLEKRVVLSDVSVQVPEGVISIVHGPSGAGKSTLLAVGAGLEEATAGAVLYQKKPVRVLGNQLLAQLFGFVFQTPFLVPELTVIENVFLKRWELGISEQKARVEAVALLEQVGCAHLGTLSPVRLSGGEQQRVALARALFGRPRLLFADEPTAHLDSENTLLVGALLSRLCREWGMGIFVSSHDERFLQSDCIEKSLIHAVYEVENGTLTSVYKKGE